VVDEPLRYLEDCPHPLPEQPWIKGVVSIGGYYNPSEFFVPSHAFGEMFQNYISHYFQGTPEEAPDRYAEASPITWVDGTEPAFAIIYNGYDDPFTGHSQALPFAKALDAAGVPVHLIEVTGDFMLLLPYSTGASAMEDSFQPTLDNYGFPEAEAFLADLFGMK
jgi:acetyl esterase/lipase